jgi:hypothetical protein
MADKPVDAEGARADLRFGNQYFDRWFKQDLPKQKEETFSQVLKYTEQARKKDPGVTLQVKSEKGEVEQVTPDSLAAAMYLAHGSYEAFNDQTAAGRLRGREHLHKSIAILPMPVAFADLARAYLSENDRTKALEIAKAGQQQYPDSFEIRQVMDKMTSDEKLGAKPSNRRRLLIVLSVFLILGGLVVLYVADAIRGAQPMSKAIFVTAGACWVIGVICFFLAIRVPPQES